MLGCRISFVRSRLMDVSHMRKMNTNHLNHNNIELSFVPKVRDKQCSTEWSWVMIGILYTVYDDELEITKTINVLHNQCSVLLHKRIVIHFTPTSKLVMRSYDFG